MIKNAFFSVLFILGGLAITSGLFAQTTSDSYGKGHTITPQDSSFYLKFEARIQTLYSGVRDQETHIYSDQILIRRSRLKLEGWAYNPKLSYKFELGLSNRDIASGGIPQSSNTANIVLDAVVKYNFYKNWTVWMGQTKLPGNIERVISSASLQFVDRSNLNSRMNIDRDVGLQLRYASKKFRYIGAISMGEGRNITARNAGGYDYTNRVEWLPFGQFASKGDYKAADLKREEDVKLLIAVTYDHNDRASRQRGQLGRYMSEQRTLNTWFVDAHLKYRGLSTMIEYASKEAPDGPVIKDDTGNFLESYYVGTALNAQLGYLFKNNIEVSGRYTEVNPLKETLNAETKQYTLGLSKYFVGHKLKVQSDISLQNEENSADELMYRFQVEITI
ncbi:porin [Fulvivirga lutimaris]|uniref:porin n=1 Tax=Fulvivirga lutimaris TaxID=1819566 RepID=UPI0012BBE2C0|nr:porin [Fulvivirga lutimaris]MTI39894.1 FmdC precursor [Fulvivirga lutimaris]